MRTMRFFLVLALGLSIGPDAGMQYLFGASHPRGRIVTVTATAYCPCRRCCGEDAAGRTATGRDANGTRGVAVDPRLIPLGSRLDVPGYGNWIPADDTGGAIKGHRIDLRMNTHAEAQEFGVRELRIRVWRKTK